MPMSSLHATVDDAKAPNVLFGLAVGILVLSLYASQPLVGVIGPSLGMAPTAAALVTTSTLLGYASGLFLLVPLADLVEARRLITSTLAAAAAVLAAAAAAPTAPTFLIASFLVGVTASAIQMLIPVAAACAPEAMRGRVVGNVMSGLMLGILFSRPIASCVAVLAGWRWFYAGQAAIVTLLAVALHSRIPRLRTKCTTSYVRLISSLPALLVAEPVLRRRALYQSCCMGAFGVFWTSVALRLATPPFNFDQAEIGMFALAGAAGVAAAPVAGRAGDRGLSELATPLAHLAVVLAMMLAWLGGQTLSPPENSLAPGVSVFLMVAAAIVLDFGVIADQTLGRRAVNMLRPEARGRLNGVFTGIAFLGGAAGAGLSGAIWMLGGWPAECLLGGLFGAVALGCSVLRPKAAGSEIER